MAPSDPWQTTKKQSEMLFVRGWFDNVLQHGQLLMFPQATPLCSSHLNHRREQNHNGDKTDGTCRQAAAKHIRDFGYPRFNMTQHLSHVDSAVTNDGWSGLWLASPHSSSTGRLEKVDAC
jgi:hypothetical protein